MFETIRKLYELYEAGNLWSLDGARLLNDLIGGILEQIDEPQLLALSPVAEQAAATTMKQLQGILKAAETGDVHAAAVDWISLLPMLAQLLAQILSKKK